MTESKVKDSQQRKIIDYLREYPGATIRELFIYLNINSPSKRLSELRAKGMIDTVRCTRKNTYGETVRFNRYYLRKEFK